MQETLKQPDAPTPLCPACGTLLHGQVVYCPSCGVPLLGTTGRLETNRLLAGRYRVVRLVARGGMGAVYLAEDTRLADAQVAVKEMSGAFARGDTQAFQRAVIEFEREAAMLARLRHAHLPRVSDRFEEDGKHFLVMEYIHGQTLGAVIRQAGGRLPLDQALDYADQLCDVLAYLHSQQPPIIYRDLKPTNVMIVPPEYGSRQPQLVLIDFGIARFYRPGGNSDTAVYGTIGYAPPEQYGRGQTDARTDIYALGVLLHHALTGHDPAATPFALPAPRALDPSIPPSVSAAIERAIANDRSERFPDIAAFRAALRAPAAPEPPVVRRKLVAPAEARPSVQAPVVRASSPRKPFWPIALVGLALLAVLLSVAVLRRLGAANVTGPDQVVVSTPAAELIVAPATQPAANTPPTANTPQAGGGELEPVPLAPSNVSASSTSQVGIDAQGNTVAYDPARAIDGKNDTAWRVDGDGAGQWLQLDFSAPVMVKKIGIIPGYDKIDPVDGTDRFAQNRVVKRVRLEFSDGTSQEASFEQQRAMQFVELPQAVRTASVRIVIEETYPPPPAPAGRDFTPLSEVVVEGIP